MLLNAESCSPLRAFHSTY